MKEKEEGILEGEDKFGFLPNGRRYKKLRTMVEEREKNSEYSELCMDIHIIEVHQIKGQEEYIMFILSIEEQVSPIQAESWFKTTTSWKSPKSKTTFEDISRKLVVNKGIQRNNS
jgi:hypothetical protein